MTLLVLFGVLVVVWAACYGVGKIAEWSYSPPRRKGPPGHDWGPVRAEGCTQIEDVQYCKRCGERRVVGDNR